MTSEAAIAPPEKGLYARIITMGVLGSYGLIAVLGLFLWEVDAMQGALSGPVLFTASLVASAVCFAAWRRLVRPASWVWLMMTLAAAAATLSQVAENLPMTNSAFLVHQLWFASYILILAGIVMAVHAQERGRLLELTLDVALVITAASLVVVRLAPGPRATLAANPDAALFLLIFGPIIALSSMLLMAVILSGHRAQPDAGESFALAGAVLCLSITSVPQILHGGACCHTGSWTALGAIGIWMFILSAAGCAWAAGEPDLPLPGNTRLRQFVAPTVAIVLAGVSMQAALGEPFGRRSALALGVLGALVALRLTELLNATRLQLTERRELAQTRALVEVSRALAGKNDLDTTLRIVTQWAARVLNARAATVEMLSNDARTLVLRAAEGLPDAAIGMTFPVDTSFTGWVIMNGEPRVTTDPQRDPFITASSLQYLGDSPLAAMPLRYRERLLGVLTCIGNRPFEAADLDLLRAFANQTAVALEDARLFEQVRALSITDPLTGLANRRQLDRELTREFAAAQRGRRLVAVMFDLDDFKQHNDKYGHIAGDDALRNFAEALHSTTRTMNLAARYGGDEFFALLADSDIRGAEIFIARVRDKFKRLMDAAGWPVVQVSAGIAEYSDEMKVPEDLLAAADRALYVVKFEADVSA